MDFIQQFWGFTTGFLESALLQGIAALVAIIAALLGLLALIFPDAREPISNFLKSRKFQAVLSVCIIFSCGYSLGFFKRAQDVTSELSAAEIEKEVALAVQATVDATVLNSYSPASLSESQSLFQDNCISKDIWTPYAEIDGPETGPERLRTVEIPNCWFLYEWGLDVSDNSTLILEDVSGLDPYGLYGISTPITLDTTIAFTLSFPRFSSRNTAKFITGIAPDISADPRNGVFLEISVEPESNNNLDRWLYRFHLYRLIDDQQRTLQRNAFIANSQQKYQIQLEISRAKLSIYANDHELIKEQSVVFAEPKLWIAHAPGQNTGNSAPYKIQLLDPIMRLN